MKMHLNIDGSLGALGNVQSYPFTAPEFIIASGHLRWVWDQVGDKNNVASWEELPPTVEIIEIEI